MPSDLVKSKADEHDISVEEAEEKWKKAKDIVQDEYDLDEDDGDEFWQLVNGVFSNMLGEGLKVAKKVTPVENSSSKNLDENMLRDLSQDEIEEIEFEFEEMLLQFERNFDTVLNSTGEVDATDDSVKEMFEVEGFPMSIFNKEINISGWFEYFPEDETGYCSISIKIDGRDEIDEHFTTRFERGRWNPIVWE